MPGRAVKMMSVVGVTLQIGNATLAPGRRIYADEDGIIVAHGELAQVLVFVFPPDNFFELLHCTTL
jgi:regulator of RNase E activity RraA